MFSLTIKNLFVEEECSIQGIMPTLGAPNFPLHLYVYGKPKREIHIDQIMSIKLAKTRIKKVTTTPSESI